MRKKKEYFGISNIKKLTSILLMLKLVRHRIFFDYDYLYSPSILFVELSGMSIIPVQDPRFFSPIQILLLTILYFRLLSLPFLPLIRYFHSKPETTPLFYDAILFVKNLIDLSIFSCFSLEI